MAGFSFLLLNVLIVFVSLLPQKCESLITKRVIAAGNTYKTQRHAKYTKNSHEQTHNSPLGVPGNIDVLKVGVKILGVCVSTFFSLSSPSTRVLAYSGPAIETSSQR